jgi:T5orf172 domain
MSSGYVYVLINDEIPNLVKVGKTKNEPEARAKQLSTFTGVPQKFVVYRAYAVKDCSAAERDAHSCLSRVFGRPNEAREFFSGSPQEVSLVLDDALKMHLINPDDFSISEFGDPFERLRGKEFTFACIEFERTFYVMDLSLDKIVRSDSLMIALGGYIAACVAINRPPFNKWILASKIRDAVLERAIKHVAEFSDSPSEDVIGYIRAYA